MVALGQSWQRITTCSSLCTCPHLLPKHGVITMLGNKAAILAIASDVVLLIHEPHLMVPAALLLVTA